MPEVQRGGVDPHELLGINEAVVLVRRPERGVVARVGKRVGDDVTVERPGPRVTLAVIDDHSHTDALDLRRREGFDLTLECVHVDVARAHDIRLDLFTRVRSTRDGAGEREEVDVSHPRFRRP